MEDKTSAKNYAQFAEEDKKKENARKKEVMTKNGILMSRILALLAYLLATMSYYFVRKLG